MFTSPLETPTGPVVLGAPANSAVKVVLVLRVMSFGPDSPGAEKIKSTPVPSPSSVSEVSVKVPPLPGSEMVPRPVVVVHPVAPAQPVNDAVIPENV